MTEYKDGEPVTETEGSSGTTARNVAIGAVAGVAAVVVAPILLPIVGLAAVSTAVVMIGAPIMAGIGAWGGWMLGGKK